MKSLKLREMVLFSLIGGLMFCSKIIMEAIPNVHLLGMFTMVCAIVFRYKGLIPIYIYVFIQGLYAGFNLWWVPYLYLWTILWGVTMLLPKRMSKKAGYIVYPLICALHGLSFGTLYMPAQALFFHLNFQQAIVWIIEGLPFDCIHAAGNFAAGFLVYPLSEILKQHYRKMQMQQQKRRAE